MTTVPRLRRSPLSPRSPWPLALRSALLLVSGLPWSPAAAQGAARLPAPAAGAYRCTVTTWTVTTPLTFTQKYDAFTNSISTVLAPTVTNGVNITLSPLGVLTLDGQGRYTQAGGDGRVTGRGAYTYDAAKNRPAFSGPLASSPARLEGYTVNSGGDFALYFRQGNTRHVCAQRVAGNPLPQRARANGNLAGRVVVSGGRALEYDLVTGQLVSDRPGSVVRLPGGLGVRSVFDAVRGEGQVEFQSGGGQALRPALRLPLSGPYVAVNGDGTRVLANVKLSGEITPDNPFGAMDKTYGWALYDVTGRRLALTREDYLATAIDAGATPAFLPGGEVLIPDGRGRILRYSADLARFQPFAPGVMPAVSPDGRRVALLQGGRTVVLTDPSGRELRRVPVPDGVEVRALTFSPDSRTLAFVLHTGPVSDSLAYAAVTTGGLEWLENRSGEALRLPQGAGQSLRLSWWTGQPALPPAWKAGVPAAGARPPAAQTPTPAQDPAAKTPWPAWLPTATLVILGDPQLSGDGPLNLTRTVRDDSSLRLVGTLDGQLDAAYTYDSAQRTRTLLFRTASGDYACVIDQVGGAELRGALYTTDPDGTDDPRPTGGRCTIRP